MAKIYYGLVTYRGGGGERATVKLMTTDEGGVNGQMTAYNESQERQGGRLKRLYGYVCSPRYSNVVARLNKSRAVAGKPREAV